MLPGGGGCNPRPAEHPVFNIRGSTRWHVPGDLMHTSCLGVCGYILGSALQEFILFKGPGQPKENLKDVWALLSAQYDAQGVTNRLTALTLPMLGPVNAPCLHAKAAETQALLGPLVAICRGHP